MATQCLDKECLYREGCAGLIPQLLKQYRTKECGMYLQHIYQNIWHSKRNPDKRLLTVKKNLDCLKILPENLRAAEKKKEEASQHVSTAVDSRATTYIALMRIQVLSISRINVQDNDTFIATKSDGSINALRSKENNEVNNKFE